MNPNRAVLNASTGQVQTIRLYGKLGARFGRVHRMAVRSAAEAVRALSSQLRGFEAYLATASDRNEGYAVFYGKRNLDKENLREPTGGEDIRIAPIVMGAKSAWVRIIVGVVLILVDTFVLEGSDGGALASLGWGMIIGGVIQLLTPQPKGNSAKDRPDNQPNYSFNGPINTQAQGYPVPVLYGEMIVGSAVLSAGILAVDVYVPTPGNGYGGGFPLWIQYFINNGHI